LDIIMTSGDLNEMIDQLIADEQAKSLANLKI
jgi:protein subunit release factor A